jgi:hypothetical protein
MKGLASDRRPFVFHIGGIAPLFLLPSRRREGLGESPNDVARGSHSPSPSRLRRVRQPQAIYSIRPSVIISHAQRARAAGMGSLGMSASAMLSSMLADLAPPRPACPPRTACSSTSTAPSSTSPTIPRGACQHRARRSAGCAGRAYARPSRHRQRPLDRAARCAFGPQAQHFTLAGSRRRAPQDGHSQPEKPDHLATATEEMRAVAEANDLYFETELRRGAALSPQSAGRTARPARSRRIAERHG